MPEKALKSVAAKFHLTAEQAAEILRLLDSGFSIPYVMRFHKDLAAGLPPEGFYALIEEQRRLEKLDSRRRKIVKKLKDRGILTDDLEDRIERARDMRELIDYYVPFRPRKRSRSRQAISQGLEPLARQILSQEEFVPDMGVAAEPYVEAQKGLDTVEAALEGVFHIVSDWVAEEKAHRDRQRSVFRREADIVVSRAGRSLPSRLAREFKMYFDYRRKAAKIHPYHMLAILRGKRLKALQYHLEPPLGAMVRAAAELYLAGGTSQLEQIEAELGTDAIPLSGDRLKGLNGTEFLVACIKYSLQNVLTDVTARELEKDLCKQAEDLALSIVRRKLKSMLMAKPLAERMLGIHPGYRTGCNLAALDEQGNVVETATVYPHPPQNALEEAKQTISRLVEEHGLAVVAIGEGTGLQETEALIADLIAEKHPDLQYAVLPEVGIEAYANSRAAKGELPETSGAERRAVALCRRLQDPLMELAKVNPRELCPEPYADEVNGGALKKLLDRTIEECVCEVGVDANTAHSRLLRYVCGLGPEKALELAEYRDKNGPLESRQSLRDVPKIDQESYERAAGFIKVAASVNPLDVTRIHPRFYPVAEEICRQLGVAVADLSAEAGRAQVQSGSSEIKLADLEKQFGVHYLLLKDIMAELANPWPDPRGDGEAPALRKKRLTIEDLEPDKRYTGTVRNIVEFGVFVDIGVGEDGLVHISELSDHYVESAFDVVSVGDKVNVRVVRVDKEKGRIALSMRSEGSRPERRPREPGRRQQRKQPRTETPPAAVAVPEGKTPGAVQTPRSTVGWQSRRVEKASLSDRLSKTQQQILKKRTAPVPPAAEEKGEEQEEKPKADVGSLIEKLGFADVERRGKPSQ
jgi:uncharacterized protein